MEQLTAERIETSIITANIPVYDHEQIRVKPKSSRVLVTGGTGTFGHAFTARALGGNLFDQIVIYSRDEFKQMTMRAEFQGDRRLRFFLGDVRDADRLERAFEGVDIVFHAAALKMVDRSAEAFDEFLKTNTFGALNVIRACHKAGVKKCVALGTDKAVEATTPYGVSKAAATWAFIGGNAWGQCRFSIVRYGNVIGSRGSVKEILAPIVERGEPLPVTDPTMTRFWMPIESAVDLVLLALDRMQGGEVFIAKDVLRENIVHRFGRWFPGVKIRVVGKRSYEKVHEKLVAEEEVDRLRDAGDVYVLVPHSWNWEPPPYGIDQPGVPYGFSYSSADEYKTRQGRNGVNGGHVGIPNSE